MGNCTCVFYQQCPLLLHIFSVIHTKNGNYYKGSIFSRHSSFTSLPSDQIVIQVSDKYIPFIHIHMLCCVLYLMCKLLQNVKNKRVRQFGTWTGLLIPCVLQHLTLLFHLGPKLWVFRSFYWWFGKRFLKRKVKKMNPYVDEWVRIEGRTRVYGLCKDNEDDTKWRFLSFLRFIGEENP